MLGLFGEEEEGIPVAQVAALKAAGKQAEFKAHQGAAHAFPADDRSTYRKEAAEDAWKQMTAWFKAHKVRN